MEKETDREAHVCAFAAHNRFPPDRYASARLLKRQEQEKLRRSTRKQVCAKKTSIVPAISADTINPRVEVTSETSPLPANTGTWRICITSHQRTSVHVGYHALLSSLQYLYPSRLGITKLCHYTGIAIKCCRWTHIPLLSVPKRI
jgi:hypothetical protein